AGDGTDRTGMGNRVSRASLAFSMVKNLPFTFRLLTFTLALGSCLLALAIPVSSVPTLCPLWLKTILLPFNFPLGACCPGRYAYGLKPLLLPMICITHRLLIFYYANRH